MRQFALTNKNGDTYILNSLENFFHDPAGLGFSRSTEYQKIGNSYSVLRDGFNQMTIQGAIMFKNEHNNPAYNKYLKFANFLQEIPLVLHYRAAKGDEYKIDVIPSEVVKTEIQSALGLDVEISFTTMSLWYRETLKTVSSSVITINSDSLIESPCCLSFTGLTLSNASLQWEQNVEGTIVMSGKLTRVTLSSDQVVYIRTDTNPYRIYKESGGNIISLYENSDFSTIRFPYLHKGNNMFTLLGASPSSMTVEGRILYETV